MDHHKYPKNNDPDSNKDRDKDLYLNRPIYRDIPTRKDNRIKIASNKDIKGKDPDKYDYKSLKNILYKDLGVEMPIEQVKVIGDGLIDLYQALYFEDL